MPMLNKKEKLHMQKRSVTNAKKNSVKSLMKIKTIVWSKITVITRENITM